MIEMYCWIDRLQRMGVEAQVREVVRRKVSRGPAKSSVVTRLEPP